MFGYFGKVWAYYKYCKIIKSKKDTLLKEYNIHIDWIGRMYTVLHATDEEYKYGQHLVNKNITNYTDKLGDYILRLGILDQVKLDIKPIELEDIKQKEIYNYLIIVEYKLINPKTLFKSLGALSLLSILSLLTYFLL